jgi:P27 family predicted phage terminase small subunit
VAKSDPTDKNARIAVTSYFAAWSKAANDLGLTPASRAKLRVDLSAADKAADPLAEFKVR